MNLGSVRIVIIVALVVAGVAVLANGFSDEGTPLAAPSVTGSLSPGSSSAPSDTTPPSDSASETPAPQTKGVLIMVLNGTNVTGLATLAQDMLVNEGYVAPDLAANALAPGVKITSVYYRPGDAEEQNKADAAYIAKTFFPGSEVGRLSPAYDGIVKPSVTVVVVVGDDYAKAAAA